MSSITETDLQGTVPLINRGKVRDIYQLSPETLLFVATDRISAYDVVMKNGIPGKGAILTALSAFWFEFLASICPNHLVSTSTSTSSAEEEKEGEELPALVAPFKAQLAGRSMIVRKLRVLPVEAIVRGYITGSAWKEYCKTGMVHGIEMPAGLKESEKLEQPLFTPSTKAEQGEHDENIHPSKVSEMVGEKHAKRIEELSLQLYTKARDYAAQRGIIIADTKFEFGLDENDNVVLVDEVLTPDSSRFWPAATYKVGKGQDSYDKQFLRDWLTTNQLNGKPNVEMPVEIAARTREKYIEAYEMLTGKKWFVN